MSVRRLLSIVVLLLSACTSKVEQPVIPAGPPTGEQPGPSILHVLPIGAEPGPVDAASDPRFAYVELAITPRDRQTGLMGRRSLPKDTGMLFVYPVSEERSFWMKNTRIPLSIAFAEEGGRIVSILDMTPDPGDGTPLPHYRSGRPAIYALEMEQGWFARMGIGVGDLMSFHPTILDLTPR